MAHEVAPAATTPARVTPNAATREGRRPRVLIVGAGFAGLHAAQALAKQPVDVTVVDRRNHHTFQPLLYQVALAVLSPADIAQPIRTILRNKPNIEVLMDEVTSFDLQRRTRPARSSGAMLNYDYLILATGSTHSYFGHDDWAHLAPGLKTVEDAIEIRRRVLLAFELAERQMLETGSHPPLNFVVIGGGPTGVELAGAITDIARLYMKQRLPPHRSLHGPRPASSKAARAFSPPIPEDLSAKGRRAARPTRRRSPHQRPRHRRRARLRRWPATSASKPSSPSGPPASRPLRSASCSASPTRQARLRHRRSANSIPPGHPEVFVFGDLAHFEQDGHQVPGVAQPAMQMGDHAAQMIARRPRPASPARNFRYFDKGDMATIGRMAAVAKVEWPFKAHWSGFPAWVTWLVVHIFFLIGFRNRFSVLFAWAWTYFTFTRGARLITGDHTLVGWNQQQGVAPQTHPDSGVSIPTAPPTQNRVPLGGNPIDVSHLPDPASSKQPA